MGVQFNEENLIKSIPKAESVTMADYLVKFGIVSKRRDADLILGLFAVLLFFGCYYFISSAITPETSLGPDVLSPGETVPDYVKNQRTSQP